MMRRRQFIALLGGAAVAGPLAARAQEAGRMRRVGVLMAFDENDPEARAYLSGFTQGLAELGWIDGRNLHIDVRWAAGNVDRMRMSAKELLDLQPEVILAHGTPATAAFQRETRTIPIVFAIVADPVGSGLVASLPRPGGNITGFLVEEASTTGKRLELLTEIAPRVKRVAALFNPDTAPYVKSYYLPSFEAAAHLLGVEPITAPVRNDAEIEAVINALGQQPIGGLVVMNDSFMFVHRSQIISVSDRNKVPAVYYDKIFAREGGLLVYGIDRADIFRRSAPYVDRILRGAKPNDLPVEYPTRFSLLINLKTAKTIGLEVPPTLLTFADEVVE